MGEETIVGRHFSVDLKFLLFGEKGTECSRQYFQGTVCMTTGLDGRDGVSIQSEGQVCLLDDV